MGAAARPRPGSRSTPLPVRKPERDPSPSDHSRCSTIWPSPTADGTAATAKAGCLIVLDAMARLWRRFAGAPINRAWHKTVADAYSFEMLFNVLNQGYLAIIRWMLLVTRSTRS